MASVGEILRTQRENHGLEVSDIAAALCITSSYVRSIENDEFRDLPNIFFFKNFVKQYALLVGVDQEQLDLKVEALVTPELTPVPEVRKVSVRGILRLQQRLHA